MKRELFFLLPVAALAVAACGSDDEAVSIEGAWARTSAAGQTTGAIYFEITTAETDTLLAASVPSSVAAAAEIHEVVPADSSGEMDGDMGDDDMDMGDGGMDIGDGEMAMVMQELESGLPLPAGETVTLQPGGYHVMLLDIAEPFEVGDEIELTLDFAEADDLTLTVEVAESAP
ncbi:MAG: copper chaperone PCu(A)C [Acidimicrobiia bacterium]